MARFGWMMVVLSAAVASGCLPAEFPPGAPDADGDGFSEADGDCDDDNAALSPETIWYADADGDLFGDVDSTLTQCDAPSGYVLAPDDCDDDNDGRYPGAPEFCDGIDQNCNGEADDGAAGSKTWYTDADKDGFGDDSTSEEACVQPANTIELGGDCDDDDGAVNPDADELCNEVDDDCNSKVDDQPTDGATFYPDDDDDGFGDELFPVEACVAPEGFTAITGDCDDSEEDINPDAVDDCTVDVDANCDGKVAFIDADDDGVAECIDCDDDDDTTGDGRTWYLDADGDGYGDDDLAAESCEAPSANHVTKGGDCDDTDDTFHPGAAETCTDPSDYNCDGKVTYADADHDGFAACDDCDDTKAAINPDADEICDGLDNDCDTLKDEADAIDKPSWYVDADGDGAGVGAATVQCDSPAGPHAKIDGDCDDTDPDYYPGAPETCEDPSDYNCDGSVGNEDADADGSPACDDCDDNNPAIHPTALEACDAANIDENCNGLADDLDTAATGKTKWYTDGDADSYGKTTTEVLACDAPLHSVATKGDCDDTNGLINPGAAEVCDAANVDEDCDGQADDLDVNADIGAVYHVDVDGDTYGKNDVGTKYCDPPVGVVANSADCNDAKAAVNPAATEVCDASNVDENCNGLADDLDSAVLETTRADWFRDADGDHYGLSSNTVRACDLPNGYTSQVGDCDDTTAAAHPGATEVCDVANVDEDCSGTADNNDANATGKSTFYKDSDGDTYGVTSSTVTVCDATAGYTASGGDCNDASAAINPGAAEVCDAGDVDEDCDTFADDADPNVTGRTSYFTDVDGDGYGDPASKKDSCNPVTGYITRGLDCDAVRATVYPGAPELCDARQNDCATSWTLASEAGHVTNFGPATPVDATAAWTGTETAAKAIVLANTDDYAVCDGTYYVELSQTAGTATVRATTLGMATLQGDGTGTILHTNGGVTHLTGVSLTGGGAARGGGLWLESGTVTLDSVVITGNTTTSAGAGFAVDAGTLTANDSMVLTNISTGTTGAASITGGTVTWIDGQFADNEGMIAPQTLEVGATASLTFDNTSLVGDDPDTDATSIYGSLTCNATTGFAADFGFLVEDVYVGATGTIVSDGCDWAVINLDSRSTIPVNDAVFTCLGSGTGCPD